MGFTSYNGVEMMKISFRFHFLVKLCQSINLKPSVWIPYKHEVISVVDCLNQSTKEFIGIGISFMVLVCAAFFFFGVKTVTETLLRWQSAVAATRIMNRH